ncbi:MAG: DNA polymerase III subunit gamma/tau [Candidatus Zixiibacteriota bacterium]
MSYEALARKWRPQTFDEVVEQPQVTQTLKNAISSGRIHHAYLFCGPRGTGKTTTARILAKALNCETGPTITPCNKCAACTGITVGSHLDVLEIDAASNTGVDNIRDLRESARYVPVSARYKIYIVDEVHRLSDAAFDALLKTLEEPPPSVIFIFATTEPNEVPATVRSRTLRLDFRLISQDGLAGALGRIAAAEHIDIEEGALEVLATEAAGSLRDGQSLLDHMAGFTGGHITAETVHEALGLVDTAILFEMTDALAAHDPQAAIGVVAKVSHLGRDLILFLRQMAAHLKRLLFARSLGDQFSDDALNADSRRRYVEVASAWDEGDLLRLLMMFLESADRYKRIAQPRLELELLAMRAAKLDSSVDIRSLIARLEGRTAALPASAPSLAPPRASSAPRAPLAVPSPSRTPSVMPEEPRAMAQHERQAVSTPVAVADPPSPAGAGPLDFGTVRDAICRTRPTLQAILGHAELIKTGPGTVDLIVYKGSPFHEKQLAQRPIRDLIVGEIARAFGEGLRVSIHVKTGDSTGNGGGNTRAAAAPSLSDPRLAGDHNLQEILRRFDGEIVG